MASCPIRLKVKRLREGAILPEAKTDGAAGLDLVMPVGTTIHSGQTHCIGLGFAVAIPEGYVGLVRPRGSAYKKGYDANGTVDADYRGELFVMLRNGSDVALRISEGERYAQLIIVPAPHVEVMEVGLLDDTARGEGRFGSTGK